MDGLAMTFDPQPVRRPREQVEAQLRSAIVNGTFQRGEKLPSEAEMATQFSVSRTTIREALRSLASDGLVRKVPGATGGSFVMAIDHHSLGNQLKDSVETILRLGALSMPEILQVRKFLEVPASELAAVTRSKAQLDQLHECINDVKNLPLGDPRVADTDTRFHSLIAEASGNRMLSAFISALHQAVRPAHYLQFSEEDGRETVLQHIAIYKALSAGDEAAARNAMQVHLDYLEQVPLLPDFDVPRNTPRDALTV